MTLALDILARAHDLGFDLVGISDVGLPRTAPAFEAWLAAGYHGEMAYMSGRAALRADPAQLAVSAASIIMVGANYGPGATPAALGFRGIETSAQAPRSRATEKLPVARGLGTWQDPSIGRVARYAWPAEYHDMVKSRLYELDAFISRRTGRRSPGKVCVDTAPLLERDFAAQAGLGFIGRNTCLITPRLGSWTFLGALLVPEELPQRHSLRGGRLQESGGTCGRCTRCLDACPTGAFVMPYVLDARRCISYLTVELRGSIPRDLRSLMGNWVFGCDICQEVCPYNRMAPPAAWGALAAHGERAALPLLAWLAMTDDEFRARFHGTALMRAKRRGLVRNACVAAGNWRAPIVVPSLEHLLSDPEPQVRGHAAWALGRIGGIEARRALERAAVSEAAPLVREEMRAAAVACEQESTSCGVPRSPGWLAGRH